MRPERARHELHDGLKEAIGDENAGTLMEMLPPYPWDEIVKRSDLEAVRNELRVDIRALETKIDTMDTKFEVKLDAMRIAFDGKLTGMYGRIVVANLALVIAISGLLLTAIKLGL